MNSFPQFPSERQEEQTFEMKAFVPLIFLFAAAKGAAIGGGDHEEYVNENLVGNWREDQYKRTGLNDFLYEMGTSKNICLPVATEGFDFLLF